MIPRQAITQLARLVVAQECVEDVRDAVLDALYMLRRSTWEPVRERPEKWVFVRRRKLRGTAGNPGQERNTNGTWKAAA